MRTNELVALVIIVLIVTVGAYFIIDKIFQPKQFAVNSSQTRSTPLPTDNTSLTTVTTPQVVSPIGGHSFSIKGENYDSDPSVPVITDNDIQKAAQDVSKTSITYSTLDDLYKQSYYRCFTLTNEGTQAAGIAQATAAGSSSRDQVLNFYSASLDVINREENCRRYIDVLSNLQQGYINSIKTDVSQLKAQLSTNKKTSQSDEDATIHNYNYVANSFNEQIRKCTTNQVVGIDGVCHEICTAPSLYCPSGSACISGQCLTCLPGFQLTGNNGCTSAETNKPIPTTTHTQPLIITETVAQPVQKIVTPTEIIISAVPTPTPIQTPDILTFSEGRKQWIQLTNIILAQDDRVTRSGGNCPPEERTISQYITNEYQRLLNTYGPPTSNKTEMAENALYYYKTNLTPSQKVLYCSN